MRSTRSPLVLIFLTIFIDMVGFGIVIPVLPLYAKNFGAGPVTIGFLVAIYSAMQFLFSPLFGRLSDRIGRRPVLVFSMIGTALGFLVMGFADAVWLLFAGRILDGISGGNISTAQAYIADVTPPERRSRAMGLMGAAFGLGFVFGPAIGGVLSKISYSAPFFFAAGLAAFNVVLVYLRLPESLAPEHRSKPHERVPITAIFRHANGATLAAIMATYFFSITGFSIMTTLYALFTNHRFGYDAAHTGYIFAFVGTIGVIIQGGLLGRLVKVFGERALATAGSAILAASLFALPYSSGLAMLLLFTGGIAIGNSLVTPTLNGLTSRNADRSWQGRALGLMQSAGSLGRLIGPVVAGFLLAIDAGGPISSYGRTPLWAAAALMVVACLLTLTFASQRDPIEEPDPAAENAL
jgi:MFS transporter, DHA1 family, tetracycline resistance protein